MVMALEMAGFPDAQLKLEVSWQVITSPFAGEYWNTWLFDPIALPLTLH
jgi:hypothetical protein